MGRNKRRTTEELIEELEVFHHKESADRMRWMMKRIEELERIEDAVLQGDS